LTISAISASSSSSRSRREEIWDVADKYAKSQPRRPGEPLNFDALVHHLEHNLEPRAAEIVGLWLQLVKAEGVDYNAPSGPKAMEDAEREYDELIA
jgi:hypothetical protein